MKAYVDGSEWRGRKTTYIERRIVKPRRWWHRLMFWRKRYEDIEFIAFELDNAPQVGQYTSASYTVATPMHTIED